MDLLEKLTAEERESLLQRSWYSHDARWFSAVAEEFGMEAANRINRRLVRTIGQAEMSHLACALGVTSVTTLPEFLELHDAARRLFVPPPLMEIDVTPIDDVSYGTTVRGCFVAKNIERAGIAGSYECAVFDRVQGWHDVLGMPLERMQMPATPCTMSAGKECRRLLKIDATGPE
ncbi:MAG: hypothetical protein IT303_10600 [Dehalococcoidia bacterium]|nr:hypothetical protein [Dehalococcoidia bacterium]